MKHEKTYVVDEEDNVITTKYRDEVSLDERVRIVAIWVHNSNSEVLLAQRAKTMSLDPGLWGPSAAGGVKVGSDYEQTAKEELFEELGLNVDSEKLHLERLENMVYETKKNGKRMCAVFKVIVDRTASDFKIEPAEVEEIKWIKKSDLINDIKVNPGKYLASCELWVKYLS